MELIYKQVEYNLNILQLDIGISIAIADANENILAIVIYEPCGDKRFDYKIATNKHFTEEQIQEILELFTERIYDAYYWVEVRKED